MHTILKKNLKDDEIDALFMSDKICVKFYRCIGTYRKWEINMYEITFRHAENVTKEIINTQIAKILAYVNPLGGIPTL